MSESIRTVTTSQVSWVLVTVDDNSLWLILINGDDSQHANLDSQRRNIILNEQPVQMEHTTRDGCATAFASDAPACMWLQRLDIGLAMGFHMTQCVSFVLWLSAHKSNDENSR